ncbi:MAG: molybdate ABC transporter substrate-binding protein [Pseudomonadota bacterium]|jgi:molybdate transport system substrate-binding protein
MGQLSKKFLGAVLLLFPLSLWGGEVLHVAAASDLIYCLEELDGAFTKARPGVRLKASTGSSGNFYAQIQNGAPFDVFMSADVKYPKALIEAGQAEGDNLTVYAAGRIVVWTVDPRFDVARGLEALLDPGVRRIAIANPEHAPYGRAAQAALESAGLWARVEGKLAKAENIAQAAQFVLTGNADAGIVALSLVKSPRLAGIGKYVEIPPRSYPRLEQAAVVTRKGASNPLAKAYLDFLRSREARAIFDRYGFVLPGKNE